MNKKNIILLIVACTVLGGVFFAIQPDYDQTADKLKVAFFNESLADKVARIEITQGQESVSIAVRDNKWTLPERSNYQADAGKVNSFLLKFFGASLSQLVTKNVDKYEKFGLTDDAVKSGKAKVVFYGQDGVELGKAYLGERRKSKSQQSDSMGMPFAGMDVMSTSNGGQYVRREGLEGVYIADDPVSVQIKPSGWIEPSVVNVIAATADVIDQFAIEGDALNQEYRLKRSSTGNLDGSNGEAASQFVLEGSADDNAKVQKSAVSLVETGLQNLRVEDVFGSDSERVKNLTFNMRTLYGLSNGLRYSVDSAEADQGGNKKIYVRINVEFDQSVADAQKARYDEARTAYVKALEEWEAKKKTTKETALPPKPEEPKPLLLAKPEDVIKQNEKHKGWVYELPEYVGKKFRQSKVALFTPEKTEEATAPSMDEQMMGSPMNMPIGG